MAITVALQRTDNTKCGKEATLLVTFDNSYPTSGETIDLSTAANGGFTTIRSVAVAEGPYDTNYAPIAQTTCCKIQYAPAASRAVATGKLICFAEDGTSGVTTQVANTTDLSTVLCVLEVKGT